MTVDTLDVSNLQGHPDTWPSQAWYARYQECAAVVVQAIEPPFGFPGHDYVDPETGKRGYTAAALRQAQADGKKIGVYVWLWNGLADTGADIRRRLETVPTSITLDMRPWVDVEDTSGGPANIALLADETSFGFAMRLARQISCEGKPDL